MSRFHEILERDIKNVFQSTDDFAEVKTVHYDGEVYTIPIIMDCFKQKDRNILQNDNAQGIHRIVGTMYAAYDDMGCQPEKGQPIFVDGKQYYVVTSECEMGQLAIGLGAFDE